MLFRSLQDIKFPDVFTEDQKQMIMNMTEMGPGGVYTLRVDGKEMGVNEAMKLFQEDKGKMDQFMEASKPKDMAQLAFEQLSVSKQMDAKITEFLKGITAYPAASSKGMEQLITALPETMKIMAQNVSSMKSISVPKDRKSTRLNSSH